MENKHAAMVAQEDPSPEGALTAHEDLFRVKDDATVIRELRAELASEEDNNAELQRELATAKNKGMAEKAANLALLPLLMAVVLLLPKPPLPLSIAVVLFLPKLMLLIYTFVNGDVPSEATTPNRQQTAPEDEKSQDSKSGPPSTSHCGRWWAGEKLDDVFKVEGSTLGQGQYGRKFL